MHSDRYPTLLHPECPGQRRIFALTCDIREKFFKNLELRNLASRRVFLPQLRERAVKECVRPAAIEDSFSGVILRGFLDVAALRLLCVERDNLPAATAFECAGFVPFVGEKVIDRSEKERAKTTTATV